MKRLMLLSAIVLSGLCAQADDYPVLNSYETLAGQLVQASTTARSQEDWMQVSAATQTLVQNGVEIMHLYAQKNPSCTSQYEVMLSEMPQMSSMTVDQLHLRYHDAVGLPEAPRNCYFGRSVVIHPAMNFVRVNGEVIDETREQVLEDFNEVIEHLAKIRQNLDTSPTN